MGLVLAFFGMLVVVGLILLFGGIGFLSFSGGARPTQRVASAKHTLDQLFEEGHITAEEYRHWSALLRDDEVHAAQDEALVGVGPEP